MKALFLAIVGTLAVSTPAIAIQCHVNPANVSSEWVTMHNPCKDSMHAQIQTEVDASVQYLAMGAHFSRDVINRPGFAKLFFDAASEEREHAMKLIDYLLMRGELISDVSDLITVKNFEPVYFNSGADALEAALNMESFVTKSIRGVIDVCERDPKPKENNNKDPKAKELKPREVKFNDYHLVDYLSGEFLEEQYRGQRDLAGKASTLRKLLALHSVLGEFIFDKKLLGMDV
uniref:Ferritin n=1 Tax=Samia ricini TaxID=63990 RepID=A0A2D1AEE0_SAMRI|nr:FerHCH [Samia ricini]